MRKAQGLTQEAFWGRVGITQSGGSRYESGRALPESLTMLLMLAYGNDRQRLSVLETLRPTDRGSHEVLLLRGLRDLRMPLVSTQGVR